MNKKKAQQKANVQDKELDDFLAELKQHDNQTQDTCVTHDTCAAQPDSQTNQANPNQTKPAPTIEEQYKNIDDLVKIANEMWQFVKKSQASNEEYKKLSDKNKLDFYRENPVYKEFMTEFPIVSRYMITAGSYSPKAFRRFLEKIRRTKHPPPTERAKGYMEDQWVRRQADYVRYLWEAYQKSHFNVNDAADVWEHAYTMLKKEFDDFRELHKSTEERVKKEKKELTAENAKDLLHRLKTGKQTLSEEDSAILLNILKDRMIKHKYNDCLKALLQKVPEVESTCEGRGTGAEYEPNMVPKVRMIEHVDPNRYDEVPEQYKMSEADAEAYLRGELHAKEAVGQMETIVE